MLNYRPCFTVPGNMPAPREMQTSRSKTFLDNPPQVSLGSFQRSARHIEETDSRYVHTPAEHACVMTNDPPCSQLHNQTSLQELFQCIWCLCSHSQMWVVTKIGLKKQTVLSKINWIALHFWTDIYHVSKEKCAYHFVMAGTLVRDHFLNCKLDREFHS